MLRNVGCWLLFLPFFMSAASPYRALFSILLRWSSPERGGYVLQRRNELCLPGPFLYFLPIVRSLHLPPPLPVLILLMRRDSSIFSAILYTAFLVYSSPPPTALSLTPLDPSFIAAVPRPGTPQVAQRITESRQCPPIKFRSVSPKEFTPFPFHFSPPGTSLP